MLHLSLTSAFFFVVICRPFKCEGVLTPYKDHHGPTHTNAFVKSCQPVEHGNRTHELYKADETVSTSGVHQVKYFSSKVGTDSHRITGHLVIINNPKRWLALMEPGGPGGCHNRRRETIVRSAEIYHCEAAINAGFFNTHTSQCLGNIVVKGRVVRDANGIQNAHFGITREGKLFFGYLSEEEVLSKAFTTLIGGVVWLLRGGQNYVAVSARAECEKTEETGPMARFIGVRSARTAVGHDAQGRLLFAHVDGKTDQAGVNLYEFADLLKSFGAINAINLDGGGSSTLVINHTVVNYPSDTDSTNVFLNVRPVTTGLCVTSPSCSNRGPVKCAGLCLNDGACNFTSGLCSCLPGFQGVLCEQRCPNGYWGRGCQRLCLCDSCHSCHHVTGDCNATHPACEEASSKEEAASASQQQDGIFSNVLLAVLVCIASLSVILNISLLCSRRKKHSEGQQRYHLLRTDPRDGCERPVRFLNTLEEEEEEEEVGETSSGM